MAYNGNMGSIQNCVIVSIKTREMRKCSVNMIIDYY